MNAVVTWLLLVALAVLALGSVHGLNECWRRGK